MFFRSYNKAKLCTWIKFELTVIELQLLKCIISLCRHCPLFVRITCKLATIFQTVALIMLQTHQVMSSHAFRSTCITFQLALIFGLKLSIFKHFFCWKCILHIHTNYYTSRATPWQRWEHLVHIWTKNPGYFTRLKNRDTNFSCQY